MVGIDDVPHFSIVLQEMKGGYIKYGFIFFCFVGLPGFYKLMWSQVPIGNCYMGFELHILQLQLRIRNLEASYDFFL